MNELLKRTLTLILALYSPIPLVAASDDRAVAMRAREALERWGLA